MTGWTKNQSGCLSLEQFKFRTLVLALDKKANEKTVRDLWRKCGGEELGRMEFELLWLYAHRENATKVQLCASNTIVNISGKNAITTAAVSMVSEEENGEEFGEGPIDGKKSEQQLAQKCDNVLIDGQMFEPSSGTSEKVQKSRKSMAICARLRGASRIKLKKIFNKLDLNQSGELSKDEFQIIIKMLSRDPEQDNIDEITTELWNECMLMSSKSSKSRASLEFEVLWKCIHQDNPSVRLNC